jgi:DNA modification methylase
MRPTLRPPRHRTRGGLNLSEVMRKSDSPAARLGDRRCVPHRPARVGDVWRLGPHRLVCGDATDPAVVAIALKGASPLLMVTDPPYGVEYDPAWRTQIIDRASGRNKTVRAVGAVPNDDRFDWRAAWALFPGDVAYVWHAALHAADVERGLNAAGFFVRSHIVWDKGRLVISRGHYHWRHEPCWYAVRKGKTAHWAGDRKQMTVWLIPHRRSETGHAAQKPIECMRRPIENHSRPGDCVYDPFVGSGTTIVAAELSGRICRAVEISPAYVDLAIARWEMQTGHRARLISCSR